MLLQKYKFRFSHLSISIQYTLSIFAILLVFYTTLVNAWIGDDAQITFRQVWNFISGDGITFNIAERVQAFTSSVVVFST